MVHGSVPRFALSLACVVAAFAAACSKPEQRSEGRIPRDELFKATYLGEIKELRKRFDAEAAADQETIDATIRYSPGCVAPLNSQNIAIDERTLAPVVIGEYVIELKPGKGERDLISLLRRKGIRGSIVGYVPTFGLYQVRVEEYGEETLGKLRDSKIVNAVSPHFVHQAEDSRSTGLAPAYYWHIRNYGVPRLWEVSKGEGVLVAVIDTGIDPDPEVFQDRIVRPYSVITRSAIFEDGVVIRDNGKIRVITHGTQVAGIIAADFAIRRVTGVAPAARIMPIQVFGYSARDGKVVTNDLAIIEGIARAIAFKADVINLSLGTDYSALRTRLSGKVGVTDDDLIEAMKAYSAGVIGLFERPLGACDARNITVVCSAGNDGMDADVQPLSASPWVLSAGAIDSSNIIGAFSNRGESVDCYAPGVDVPAVSPGKTVFMVSGTSFSAPYVAGVIAIAKGGGYRKSLGEYKRAIRGTNFQARSSLFPSGSIEVFHPANFLKGLGAKVDDEGPLAFQFAFYEKYGDLFIQEGDSDMVAFRKIMMYYQRRRHMYENDAESIWAAGKAAEYFDEIFNDVVEGGSLDYWEAEALGNAVLDDERLRRVSEHALDSDYIALILRKHRYKQGFPKLMERIERRKTSFNGNSLMGILDWGDREVVGKITVDYLRGLQSRSETFVSDEDVACYVVARTAKDSDPEAKELIRKSGERVQSSKDYWDAYYLSMALIEIGEKRGVSMIIDTLEYLDDPKFDERAEPESLETALNSSTRFGLNYSYLDPPEDRKRIRAEFRRRLESSTYSDGKFIF